MIEFVDIDHAQELDAFINNIVTEIKERRYN